LIKNYLKVAWRNLVRNKAHTFINIAGLSVGLACSILILLWVQNELSVDANHTNNDRLYQVYEREYYNHKIDGNYDTGPVLARELKKTIPEIEYAVALQEDNDINTFSAGNKIIKEEGTAAYPDLFKMFSYPLLQGSPQSALSSPVSIAISHKMANQFFGSPQAAMGKTIRFKNKRDFSVTAVFEDLPQNTSRRFDYLINWQAFVQERPWAGTWGTSGPRTFVMLRKDANPALVEKKITHFVDTYTKFDKTYRLELGLQKFSDVYLHSNFNNGKIEGGRIEYVHLFSIVAVFILLIACINFMNLTTARSIKRAREIGVRKVLGAVRLVLIKQFMGEALMLTLFAVMFSLVLLNLLLPVFNTVTQKDIALPFNQYSFWLKLSCLTLVTGCIAGSYPALFLSSFKPVKVLKGIIKLDTSAVWFRKGLVIFQFALSVMLITGTVIVSKQINFIQTRNLGYDKENLIYIPVEGDMDAKYEAFKNEALKMPGIKQISRISDDPTDLDDQTVEVNWTGKDPGIKVQFATTSTGYDLKPTMKLEMIEGRDFSRDFPSDSTGFIINEAAMKTFGYAAPIGKNISINGMRGHIIGMVKDFNFESLHKQIEPLIIRLGEKEQYGEVLIRTQPGKTKEALASLEKLYKQLNPAFPFTYTFSDEEYKKLYQSEQVVGNLSNAFAFLAIFISCLGLLGLAMFTAEQRVKEIGIRKILGASVASLFALLSSEFLWLVLIALLIASPIAWYAMNGWLQTFAYRTPVEWWMFVLSGGLIIGIALATVSFQAIKAALINPVKSLRSE
jgi:putative ABC transport system permease protein